MEIHKLKAVVPLAVDSVFGEPQIIACIHRTRTAATRIVLDVKTLLGIFRVQIALIVLHTLFINVKIHTFIHSADEFECILEAKQHAARTNLVREPVDVPYNVRLAVFIRAVWIGVAVRVV